MKPAEFIEKLAVDKWLTEARDRNRRPSIMIAQAALESGWGGSSMAKQAKNWFGIKAHGSWKGPTYTQKSSGHLFRVYDTPADGIKDYLDFLDKNPRRYKNITLDSSIVNCLNRLQASGYAGPDQEYGYKLAGIINSYDLWKYDKDLTADIPIELIYRGVSTVAVKKTGELKYNPKKGTFAGVIFQRNGIPIMGWKEVHTILYKDKNILQFDKDISEAEKEN